MGMTRDELVTEILKIVGLYDDATNYEARCRTWLNQTQVRTARRHFWNDLKQLNTSNATVASQKTYSLSTDWSLTNIHKIHSIRLISGNESRRLDYIGARRMDTWLPYPTAIAEGKPNGYVRWGDNCEFIPIPDDAYTLWVRWSTWPTAFAASDSECDILNIDDLLLAATAAWAYKVKDEAENSQEWAATAEFLYQNALENDEDEPDYVPEPEEFGVWERRWDSEYWLRPDIDRIT